MGETWFRGEAAGGPVSSPGGSIHDFGDGMYLTDTFSVARTYAQTRTADPNKQLVLAAELDPGSMGRVLDLRTDPRWAQHFEGPGGARLLELIKTGRLNEIYGKTFNSFLEANKIDRNQYDVIIGPEYVREGMQMCITHKNGQPSALAGQVRASFKVVTIAPPGAPKKPIVSDRTTPTPSKPDLSGQPKGVGGRIMRNQNVAAFIGTAIGGLAQWLGDKGIQMRIQEDLETKYSRTLEMMRSRGDGVLLIIHMQEWETPDFNGMRARTYMGLSLQSGQTELEAKSRWYSQAQLLPGPARGWRPFDTFSWIPPDA